MGKHIAIILLNQIFYNIVSQQVFTINNDYFFVFVFFLGWGMRHVLEKLLGGYGVELLLFGKQKFPKL